MNTAKKIPLELLVVALGGCLGGGLRYLLGQIPFWGPLPLTTLLINWVGSFALALLGVYLAEHDDVSYLWPSFVGTGILGGFTTFSTMILQVYQQYHLSPVIAIAYLVASLVGAIVLIDLAHGLGAKLFKGANHD
ncbi:CrcB family protein [Leuconostocaceae bacterium ESL0723]|nr:CrcB family protein [Leuconostocaceae bacterium ESL0723]